MAKTSSRAFGVPSAKSFRRPPGNWLSTTQTKVITSATPHSGEIATASCQVPTPTSSAKATRNSSSVRSGALGRLIRAPR